MALHASGGHVRCLSADYSIVWSELMDAYCQSSTEYDPPQSGRGDLLRCGSKKLKQVLNIDVLDVRSCLSHSPAKAPAAAACRELEPQQRDAPCHGVRHTDTSKASSISHQQHSTQQQQAQASVSERCAANWVYPQCSDQQVLSDYEFGMPLGRGSFGSTSMVMHRRTAAQWACKSINKGSVPSRRKLQQLRNEVSVLQHLTGVPGVVQLGDVYEDRRSVHLVIELCRGGELLADLQRHGGRYCDRRAAATMRAILATLQRCHAAGVMHRDIKPENFLLVAPECSSTGSARTCCCGGPGAVQPCCSESEGLQPCCCSEQLLRLTDFGSATFFNKGQVFSDVVGTAAYVAPEVLAGTYGEACDIWSAGVMLYLLLSGRLPFDGSSDRQVLQSVLHDDLDITGSAWEVVSESAKAVVRLMLCKDPKQRPSAGELLQHPWVQRQQALEAPLQAQQQQQQQQEEQEQLAEQPQAQQQLSPPPQPQQQQQQQQEEQAQQANQQLHHTQSQQKLAVQLLKQAAGAMQAASIWSASANHRPLVHVHAMAVQCCNM